MRMPRRVLMLWLVPVALVVVGTIGYRVIEAGRYDLFDSLYMTIVTLSTIGYGETHELSRAGRVFTIFLILSGVSAFFYSVTEIARSVVGGEMANMLGKRKMERTLATLKDHIIVCGYGRMGRLVCREFARNHRPFVVIDINEADLRDFECENGIKLVGDATSDDVLRHAGIERAHSLVTVMSSDADNLFTTLSARLLNPKVVIVARVEEMQSGQKLIRAGANRVVSPYEIGGQRVAQAVIKPTVVDFIDLTSQSEHIALQMEERRVEANSALAGSTLDDSRLHAEHHLMIVAIKKPTGQMVFNPPVETVFEVGDILIAIGHRDHLGALDKLAKPKA
ncbi:MAG: potassium channel protein [Planctomycetota bacterium]|nr:potassium channel protein [Planctomycetota bacterium]